MPNQPDGQGRSGGGAVALGVGAVVLAVICCAGPVLVAAGALGILGGALHNPFVLMAAAVVLTGAVLVILRRRGAGAVCDVPNMPPTHQQGPDRAHDRPPGTTA